MTLEAFASGRLPSAEAVSVEAHLDHCLGCAERLEVMTRTQLDGLAGLRGAAVSPPPLTSPVLERVMQRATESGAGAPRLDPHRIFEFLDPSGSPGTIGSFAGFEILEIAGSGGMGVVLKARDLTLDRIVAIKVLFPAGSSDEAFAARFLEEARTVASLNHDGVVTVHHAGRSKGLAYLVMPFHAEGTLEAWLLSNPRPSPIDVARLGLQLAGALAVTHARGILHRDIKPSNVLLEDGLRRVRLADFGLAQSRPASAVDIGQTVPPEGRPAPPPRRMVAGTPHYMSPEQARGELIDARSDLFGLGAVLYQMASGQCLYPGETSKEVLKSAVKCEIRPIRAIAPELPPQLARVIDRLLARRPEDRFASAAELVQEFDRVVHPRNVGLRRVGRIALRTSALGLLVVLCLLALELSGRTAWINSLLSRRNGQAFSIRGRFGTYAELASAVQAGRSGEVVELRYSGERTTDGFRVGGKSITLRAADHFTPVLVATNEGQPLILADGPLVLEGLSLVRRSNRAAVPPLISAEGAPVSLLNCRLARAQLQGEPMLVRGGKLLPSDDESRMHRPLIRVSAGGSIHLRNSLILARLGSAIGFWGGGVDALQAETEDCLFVIHRAFTLRCDQPARIQLVSSRSVFVTTALLDLDDASMVGRLTARWENCLVDRSQGALLRLNEFGNGDWARSLEWGEKGVVYGGQGVLLSDRRSRQIQEEAEWNQLMNLRTNDHRFSEKGAFAAARARSSLRVDASDVDFDGMVGALGGSQYLASNFIGEGEAYERFQREPTYGEWQQKTRLLSAEWKKRQP